MVLEITVTDQANSAQLPRELTDVNGKLYVTAQDANGDRELYFIGPNGAPIKIDVNATGSSSPEHLTNVNGTLFFSATDASGDDELFYLDANNNVIKVGGASGVNPNGDSFPDSLNNVNGELYFRATNASGALKLFVVDANKNLVETPLALPGGFYQEPVFVGDTPYFSAQDATGDSELYILGQSYVPIKIDVNTSGSSFAQSLTTVGSTLYFRAQDANGNWGLYLLGPNNTPTQIPLSNNLSPQSLVAVENVTGGTTTRTLYFTATDSNGTQGLYYLRRNNNLTPPFESKPVQLNGITGLKALTAINGNLYFSGTDANGNGDVFYVNADASDLNKVAVKLNVNPPGNTAPEELSLFNDNLFFIANNGNGGGTFYGLVERISVTNVALPTTRSYGLGQNLDFVITFDEVVNVDTTSGVPTLGLTLDSGAVNATYVSGTGTKQLIFRYTIAEGNIDVNGISVGSLSLNGGVLQGNLNGIPTLTLPGTIDGSGIRVDTETPTVTIAPVSPVVQDGRANVATNSITFTFSEAMAGFNVADLQLTRNGQAVVLSGATLSNVGNVYTLSGLSPVTGIDGSYTLSLDALGSGITDVAGNPLAVGGSVSWKRGTMALPPAAINFRGGLRGRRFTGTAARQTILGTTKNDTLSGMGGNDTIRGYAGLDLLNGGTGNDTIFGGTGNDRINGGTGRDVLSGEGANDLLKGDAGNDSLSGGAGNDILVGGLGADTLLGGAGRDAFSYNRLSEVGDTIRNFQVGLDVIDLSPLFRTGPFNTGATAFAKFDKFVKLTQVGASTRVQIDRDGAGVGTTFVTLATITNVAASQLTSRSFAIA